MFENFSFEAASRQTPSNHHYHSYSPEDVSIYPSPRPSRCVSPTCTSFSNPMQDSLSDLARQFSEHSLRPKTRRTDSGYESQRSSFAREEANLDPYFSSLQPGQPHSIQLSTKRTQRQDSMRLQTETFHLREISTLVQRMVDDRDQCALCRPTSSHSDPSTHSESEDDIASIGSNRFDLAPRRHNLPYKRSSEVLKGRPGVTKDVRMRKSRSRLNINANGARRP